MLRPQPLFRPLLRTSTRPLTTSLPRYATVAPPEVTKIAPADKVPFKAPEADTTKGELGQVFIPHMRDYSLPPLLIKIPGEPDNYTLENDPADDFPSFHEPQVVTVASATTHHGGGPSHGTAGDDVQPGEEGDSVKALPKEADVSIKPIVFHFEERDLDAEEKRGLGVLGGIFVVGWLLGGLGNSKKGKKKAKKEKKGEEGKKEESK